MTKESNASLQTDALTKREVMLKKRIDLEKVGFSQCNPGYLSTSQACMCAIALCRPDLLEKERITPSQAWSRINREQLDAILEFTGANAK